MWACLLEYEQAGEQRDWGTFGSDVHRSSWILGVSQSTGPSALQAAQIRDSNFPVDFSGTTEPLALPAYRVNINRYKNGFSSPFWINYICSPPGRSPLDPPPTLDSLDFFATVFCMKRFGAVGEGHGENWIILEEC